MRAIGLGRAVPRFERCLCGDSATLRAASGLSASAPRTATSASRLEPSVVAKREPQRLDPEAGGRGVTAGRWGEVRPDGTRSGETNQYWLKERLLALCCIKSGRLEKLINLLLSAALFVNSVSITCLGASESRRRQQPNENARLCQKSLEGSKLRFTCPTTAIWEPQVNLGEAAKLAARWSWLLRRVREQRGQAQLLAPDQSAEIGPDTSTDRS
jgi:hypothetical protein